MALDLEEQEKLAEMKAWWNKFGGALTAGALVAALGFAGYNGWQWYVRKQSAEASAIFEVLRNAAATKDAAKLKESTGVLLEKYPGTAYAEMGALTAAKANLDAGDSKTAKAQLQWVVEHATDTEYQWIARLRLSGLLLDENALDEALKQVGGDVPNEFKGAFADRRGDILVAQKKIPEAKKEYESALSQLKQDESVYANVVQIKLDSLSSEGAAATLLMPTATSAQAGAQPDPEKK